VETAGEATETRKTFTGVQAMAKETEDQTRAREQRAARNAARLDAMFQGRPPHEKFLALMMMNSAGPEQTEAALNAIQGGGSAMETRIPELDNRPIRQFAGKTRAQLRREFDGDESKVGIAVDALRGAGLNIDDEPRARNAADETEDRAKNPARLPHAAGAGSLPIGPGGGVEPTFGAEQFPASELWHLSDADLSDVEGIDAGAVVRIRQLQREEMDRSTLAAQVRAQGTGTVAAPLTAATPEGAEEAARLAAGGTAPAPVPVNV
jgi:hypothetical protein